MTDAPDFKAAWEIGLAKQLGLDPTVVVAGSFDFDVLSSLDPTKVWVMWQQIVQVGKKTRVEPRQVEVTRAELRVLRDPGPPAHGD